MIDLDKLQADFDEIIAKHAAAVEAAVTEYAGAVIATLARFEDASPPIKVAVMMIISEGADRLMAPLKNIDRYFAEAKEKRKNDGQ